MSRSAWWGALVLAGCSFDSQAGSSGAGLGTHSGTVADDGGDGGDDGSTAAATSTSGIGGNSGSSGDTGGPADPCAVCSPNATCTDRTCTCNAGWVGDGVSCVVEAELDDLRFTLPCMGPPGESCASTACPTEAYVSDMATMTGSPKLMYDVTFHFRGVVERKEISGGTTDGSFNEGGTPASDQWNLARLTTTDGDRYYLNAGPAMVEHTWLVDFTKTLPIRGGAGLTLDFIDVNTCALYNHDENGTPISVPGIVDPPQPFDGQFLIAEVVSIVPQ